MAVSHSTLTSSAKLLLPRSKARRWTVKFLEIDGAYFGGHIRPENRKETARTAGWLSTRPVRAASLWRSASAATAAGLCPFVTMNEAEGVEIAKRVVSRMSRIHADEAAHWDALHAGWLTARMNHSEAYSLDGSCTNQVESYFSRLRRMVDGQHHRVWARYLHQYANEAAWKEDHRRMDNGALARRTLGLSLGSPVSRQWAGYWQRLASDARSRIRYLDG